jgi:hypothetical protein
MDPYSTAITAADLTDVLYSCSIYLNGVPESAGRINGKINALLNALRDEINALITVNEAIENLSKTFKDAISDSQTHTSIAATRSWNVVKRRRQGCNAVLLELEGELRYIIGEGDTSKRTKNTLAGNSKDTESGQSEPTSSMPGNTQNRALGKFDGIKQRTRMQSSEVAITKILSRLKMFHFFFRGLLRILNS